MNHACFGVQGLDILGEIGIFVIAVKQTLHLTKPPFRIQYISPAGVAEQADALRSGRSELTLMRVRLPPSAQKKTREKRVFFR